MSLATLPDGLWEQFEPLLPPVARPGPAGGRPRISNRTVMAGIYYILCSGIRWELLPKEFGCSA